MKKISLIISFIMLTLGCYSQSGFSSLGFGYDCEKHESYTPWEPQDSLNTCDHDWVYAQWGDVNQISLITNAVYCPCGCGGSSNEARICKKCLLSQKRVLQWWYESVENKSEYIQLLEKK